MQTSFATELSNVIDRYDGFIVDQWGVLHDGGALYPGVIDRLTALREAGKPVVLLSNSGKRAESNGARLQAMGLPPELYAAVVTSGEACWQALRDHRPPFAALGRRCILWGRDGDPSYVAGLDVEVVDDVDQADFIYLAGIADYAVIETFLPLLEAGNRRDLPLVCANPDITAIFPGGGSGMAPGAIARRYEAMGGKVIYVGKPHAPVYELALQKLAPMERHRILAIGDSLEHDIAGGNAMGLDTMLISSGIHKPAFEAAGDDKVALDALMAAFHAVPRYVAPRFA